MYYFNQQNNYDIHKQSLFNNQYDQYYPMKSKQSGKQHGYKSTSFSSRFMDSNQRYLDYDNAPYSNNSSFSSTYSSISPTNFLTGESQFYDSSYNRSLSSSFDEDSSYLSVSLSSSTSSLEFSESSSSLSQSIWSSALYSPNLHPGLFESWSTKMNKSIYQLNEELKNYDRINNEMVFNFEPFVENHNQMYINNQIENFNYMNDLFNQRTNNTYFNQSAAAQKSLQYHQSHDCSPYQYQNEYTPGDSFISYEEMMNKVDNLLDLSLKEYSEHSRLKKSLKDVTNLEPNKSNSFQNAINISTSSENLEQDSDDKSSKSTSPRLKFTAPRFEKKWLKTQSKQSYAVSLSLNCPNVSEFPSKQNRCAQNYSANGSPGHKYYSSSSAHNSSAKKTNENESQKGSFQARQHGQGSKWNSNCSLKSTHNHAFKFNKSSSHAQNNNSKKNCSNGLNRCALNCSCYPNCVNENENNSSGYRVRNKNSNNNRYRYRAGSKSRA